MKRTSQTPRRLALLCMVVTLAAVFAGRPLTAAAAPGDITTVAGTGNCCFGGGDGDGGPALSANIPPPYGVATAPGRFYFSQDGFSADGSRVRVVQNGTINSYAGGVFPPSTYGGPATQTFLPAESSVIADAAGDLYIPTSDGLLKVDATSGVITVAISGSYGAPIAIDGAGNLYLYAPGNTVVKVDHATNTATTVAGGGNPPDGIGDGGPATGASFSASGLAVDAAGDLYIADQNNNTVRRVDAVTGIINTVAGGGGPADGLGDGGPATSGQFAGIFGIALDAAGNLYVADAFNDRVRKVDTTGIISTFAGSPDPPGNQCPYSGDGGPATSANLCSPTAMAPDAAGNVYIADAGNSLIRKVDSSGTITTVAGKTRTFSYFGDGGPASSAEFNGMSDIALAPAGKLLIAGGNNRIRAIDQNGMITTVAGGGVGDGLPALSTMLSKPEGLAADPSGNLLIADCGDNRVRKVDSSGTITSIAGVSGPHGLGDAGPATAAALQCPAGLAFDSAGNLYIADSTDNRVRRVDTSGIITTVAGTGAAGFSGDGGPASSAQLNGPEGLVFDSAGDLYIADRLNDRVRKVDTSGKITTIAGNGTEGGSVDGRPATSGPVVWPVGLAIGPDGSLKIAESGFASIRSIDAKGIISTIAGNGIPGYTGDGGPGPLATLAGPMNIAYDSSGNLLFADNQNFVIRSIAAGTPPPPVIATKKTTNCGMVVTQNLTLSDDIGPCPGDGLIIGANGVHLNLNGHTITGSYSHAGTSAGIRVTSEKDAKISGGTVTGFDAGIALISGSNNVVTGMTVANNQGNQNTAASTYGDGIVMFASSRNTVTGNRVLDNGPFDGIGMIGQGADNNLVQNNTVKDTTNFNHPFNPGLGAGIITNPFLGFDRPRMVSLNANQIVGNTVINNGTAGISTISNVSGVVRSNVVELNGKQSPFGGAAFPGNGIGITHAHNATATTNELVEYNQVIGNGRDGIQVIADGNQILDNVGTANGGRDFRDFDRDPITFQPTCLNNTWSGNRWGTGGFFPQCASNGGSPLPATATLPVSATPPIPGTPGDPPPRKAPS